MFFLKPKIQTNGPFRSVGVLAKAGTFQLQETLIYRFQVDFPGTSTVLVLQASWFIQLSHDASAPYLSARKGIEIQVLSLRLDRCWFGMSRLHYILDK